MHAVGLLRNCLGVVLGRMHALRCAALLDAVRALIAGRRLTLMELARSWPDALRVAALKTGSECLICGPRWCTRAMGWSK